MLPFLVRRVLLMVPVLAGIIFITFGLLAFAPGSYISLALSSGISNPQVLERVRQQLRLDEPWYERFGHYLWDVLHGDLGQSIVAGQPVISQLWAALPNTLILTISSLLFAVVVSLIAGSLAGARPNTAADYLASGISVLGVALPSFWLGLMLILLFSLKLRWLPLGGGGTGNLSQGLWPFLSYLILPTVALGSELTAILTRLTRGALLDVLSEDYIRTARAKGVSPGRVLYRHALRNAALPLITTAGIQFGGLLGGAVVVETIFSWPGMGLLTVSAIQQRDLPMIQGSVLVFATLFVVSVLITDLLYTLVDPRIQYD
ncbi:ABC transporter permease [Deinococcus sp. KSM4-11]|uniref:ABC transporter permease n=1 Tax=Deinococcus sp. KSM4-11 TaxID=2568654 RepID=UPI0010A40B43|nr:ABC transporter permease [Deinococcus sp. KSM4-11]THF85429.1 ABC transporter permease [Deinococcus sp. KSM4-11]